jgi:hypothetical protein
MMRTSCHRRLAPYQTNSVFSAKRNPDVDFTVIVNPCSGSCQGKLPDQYYQAEIPKLKTYRNVRTLGYVATNYTNKPIDEVISEVQTYAEWQKHSNNTKFRVDGIFFDETPTAYSEEKFQYLKKAAQSVKNSTTFRDRFVGKSSAKRSPRKHLILAVHNPGNIPLASLTTSPDTKGTYLDLADITVVFEEKFDKWLLKDTFDSLRKLKVRKSKLAVMVHSMPEGSIKLLEWVVDSLNEMAGHYFVTTVQADDAHYNLFSPVFKDLVGLTS